MLAVLWPDTIVEEANLTQSVSTLRKILGDTPKDHQYIATIPGRGYSFVAAVTEEPSDKGKRSAKPQPKPRLRTKYRSTAFVGIAACVLLTGLVLYITHRQERHFSEPQISRFTSYPGIETMPAFSPDGKQLAYVRADHDPIHPFWRKQVGRAHIYVKLIEAATEIQLTNHSGFDSHPAWSPDGQYIAFHRDEPGASGYYVVSALGGHERRVTQGERVSAGIAWLPDGRYLAISQFFEGSHSSPLFAVSLDTGEKRPLTSPPAGTLGDILPAASPDGRTLAFLRINDSSAGEACFTPLKGGASRCRPVNGSCSYGLAWTASGDGVIVATVGATGYRLWRYSVNGGTPVAVTSGEEQADMPAVSRQGDQLAYVVTAQNMNLWQLRIGPSQALQSTQIVASSRQQYDPAFSPDSRKITYSSDRTGSQEIWITDLDTHAAIQLTHMGGPSAGSPSWSPDGLQIAFDSGHGAHPDIFVISADGGTSRRITSILGENVVPSWSRDGRFIYFASSRSGGFQIWKAFAATGETPSHPAVQLTKGGGFRAFESDDGKYLYYAKGRGGPGLWRRSLADGTGGKEEPVMESLQEWGWWALGKELIYFFEAPHSFDPGIRLKVFDIAARRVGEIFTLPSPVPTATPVMAVSPDGRRLAYLQIDSTQSDIMLVQNFR